jgi:putative tricarboxylic transport membrane protein
MMYGLQPGPLLFQEEPGLVWAIVASMYVGNVVLLLLNLPLVGMFVKLLSIPTPLLFSGVLAFVVLGAYALSFNIFPMLLILVFGVLGYFMQEYDFPLAPAVLALVLEPLLETNLRRALDITGGDVSTFVTRPASLVLVVACVGAACLPLVQLARRRGSQREEVLSG